MKASTRKLIIKKSVKIKQRTLRGSKRWCVIADLSRAPAGAPRNKKTGKVLKPKKGKKYHLEGGCFGTQKKAAARQKAWSR